MEKIIIIFLVGFLLNSCVESKSIENLETVQFESNQNGTDKKYNIAKTEKGKQVIEAIELLNNKNYQIPSILNNLYLDYEFNEIHLTYGKGVSTRSFIIENIENKEVLEFILSSQNNLLDKIPDSNLIKEKYNDFVYEMPFANKSIKELVKEKLELLK